MESIIEEFKQVTNWDMQCFDKRNYFMLLLELLISTKTFIRRDGRMFLNTATWWFHVPPKST